MREFAKKIMVIVLTLIARGILWRAKPRIIAVTGNVGKTSTKDAIYVAHKSSGSVRRSEKSFNSDLGVPLSIIGAQSGWNDPVKWLAIVLEGITQILIPSKYPKTLVLEVGADRPGDISRIAKWLRPHIVVLTRLPEIPVHIEFFPTLESLIEEKLSLARHVRKDGVLVLNADDERIMSARADLRSRTVTYGFSESADIRGSNVQILAPSDDQAGGVTFKIDFDGNSFPVMLPNIYAESHVSVALAALATSYASGINMVKAIEDIAEYSTPPGRVRLILGKGDTILIDDTYNSSPTAVEAGLSMLSSMPFGKRKIAVLGDMLELGRHTEEAHHAMGVLVKKSADILITVGLRAKQFAEGARSVRMGVKKIFEVDTAEQAAELMEEIMKPGDMIFVKGSQSMRMENFVKHMMAEPERASELLVRQEKEWARK